jgi:hypothetical protein
MTDLELLWVTPADIDESLNLETIDPSDVDTLKDYEAALQACEFASQMLWTLSGRKFHTGKVITERYIVDRAWLGSYTASPVRGIPTYDRDWGVFVVDPYDWNNRKIKLDGTPVRSIGSVTNLATGENLDPSEYSIVNRAFLQLESFVPRGIDVSYTYGTPPPITGRMAAKAMATQFFLQWSGRESECDLPDRVMSVTREGVNWVLLDNQDFLDELKTGIYMVDMFLRSVNPDKARVKAKVFSVDLPRGRRRSL